LADALAIELLYLPPYSPNLNLIEWVWKLVKKKCLYAKYYEDVISHSKSEGLLRMNNFSSPTLMEKLGEWVENVRH
jgi:transposase